MNKHPAPAHRAVRPPPGATGMAVALLCVASLGANPALAQPRVEAATPLPAESVAAALALARQAATAMAPAGARITASAGTLDARMRLTPCPRIETYLPAAAPPWGRTRIGLRCTAPGLRPWNVFLPVTVQVLAPAVVTVAALPAGARLAPSQLALAEVDWAGAGGAPFAALPPLADRVLVRPLAAGQALRAADLQARQWFAIGDLVRITARGAGYAVQAEGQALSPGREGQPARVRTDSGRIVVGRPIGERQLEVLL